jgi:hypothetical protein
MSTDHFYQALPALERFLDLANPQHYQPVPPDWYVMITDVTGSTQAVQSGRYKEVNLLGASSIMAVLNAVPDVEIPFVFGGDGASLLVPPTAFEPARQALLGVRKLAQASFGLDLRVGVVPVEVVAAQHPLQVAKFLMPPRCHLASFMGGGLTYATELVKQDPTYQLEVTPDTPMADLSGLECRWQDILSRYGQTLSLIVSALGNRQSHEQVYEDVIQAIQAIYGDDRSYHPVANSALKLSFNPRRLNAELKAKTPGASRWQRWLSLLQLLVENLLGWCLMRFNVTTGDVRWGQYKNDVVTATDYQKIDDLLRMVIASRAAQTKCLIEYLEQQSRIGNLAYGLHISDRALMTCLIFDRRDRHIHLIDGADGGYAIAAKSLKERLHRKAHNWRTYSDLLRRRKPQP